MEATVIQAFKGVPDGTFKTRTFAPGDKVRGSLAQVAIDNGWAKGPKRRSQPKKPRSGGSASQAGQASTGKTASESDASEL